MKPLRVYLDSSDFSLLSDTRRRNADMSSLLRQLRQWVAEEKVVCLFSGTHLSEMAPVDVDAADAAQRRADLLVELCGRNVLISQDRLFAEEFRYAHGDAPGPPTVTSSTGDWFPDGVAELTLFRTVDISQSIREAIKNAGGSRETRRLAERKALKGGKPRAHLQAALVSNARDTDLQELLEQYPMRPEAARVIGRYIVGDASAADAQNAFLESLRDPRWMMQWFRQHHAKLTPFLDWTRKPAVTVMSSINAMAAHAASVRAIDASLGTTLADELFSSPTWKKWQDDVLLRVAHRIENETLSFPAPASVEVIDDRCRGLSVAIRSLHQAWWASTAETPRPARHSDFPDALHSAYAPYVDIFRADSFMAPYISRYAGRHGTKVVPKLPNLVPTIQAELDLRG